MRTDDLGDSVDVEDETQVLAELLPRDLGLEARQHPNEAVELRVEGEALLGVVVVATNAVQGLLHGLGESKSSTWN